MPAHAPQRAADAGEVAFSTRRGPAILAERVASIDCKPYLSKASSSTVHVDEVVDTRAAEEVAKAIRAELRGFLRAVDFDSANMLPDLGELEPESPLAVAVGAAVRKELGGLLEAGVGAYIKEAAFRPSSKGADSASRIAFGQLGLQPLGAIARAKPQTPALLTAPPTWILGGTDCRQVLAAEAQAQSDALHAKLLARHVPLPPQPSPRIREARIDEVPSGAAAAGGGGAAAPSAAGASGVQHTPLLQQRSTTTTTTTASARIGLGQSPVVATHCRRCNDEPQQHSPHAPHQQRSTGGASTAVSSTAAALQRDAANAAATSPRVINGRFVWQVGASGGTSGGASGGTSGGASDVRWPRAV
jgi:hypothetical protein